MSGQGISASAGWLPDRHPNGDFFVCDIFDAAPKDDLGSMEHPIFSLSTRPRTEGVTVTRTSLWV